MGRILAYENITPVTISSWILFTSTLLCSSIIKSRAAQGKNSKWLSIYLLILSMCYIALLVAILCNPIDWLRNNLSQFDPILKTAHVESQFDTACNKRMSEGMEDGVLIFLWNQIEGYVLSHSVGWWWCCLFLAGDAYMCFIMGVVHEISELWFERFYAPFRECWWDHLFLDMGCNFLGCLAGGITLYLLGTRTPIFTRKMLKKKTTWILITGYMIEEALRFPMVFFLPHVLGVPPKNMLNLVRFFTVKAGVLSLMCAQLYGNLIKRSLVDRFHVQWIRVWMIIISLETAVVLKFQEGKFFDGVFERPLFEGSSWQQYNPFHKTTPWMPFYWNLVIHFVIASVGVLVWDIFAKMWYASNLKSFLFLWIPVTKKEGLEFEKKSD